jgi:hypothetical protein
MNNNMSYIKCRKCSSVTEIPHCSCDLPVFFVFVCKHCGYRTVYSYLDVVDNSECKEKCKIVVEVLERLQKIAHQVMLYSMLQSLKQEVDKRLKKILGEEQ